MYYYTESVSMLLVYSKVKISQILTACRKPWWI